MAKPKVSTRRFIKMASQLLPQSYIDKTDRIIAKKFLDSEEYKNAERIFAYYSVDREVSTHEIIRKALSDGKCVALPISYPSGFMIFHEIHDLGQLRLGRYDIPEPDESCPIAKICDGDLVIVPALSCDEDGNRIGRGEGYYDRFLADHDVISVCLVRAKLMLDEFPIEPHDQKVKIVINEK